MRPTAFPPFMNVASTENLYSWYTRNLLEFAAEASDFENYEFTEVASTGTVGMLVLSSAV